MKLILQNRTKISQFIAIFQLLKTLSETTCIYFSEDSMMIQQMDKSHVCLCDIHLYSDWFELGAGFIMEDKEETETEREKENTKFTVHTAILFNILHFIDENQTLEIIFSENKETICIDFKNPSSGGGGSENKKIVNKSFQIQCLQLEQDIMSIPKTDYNVEFTILSKTIIDIFSQMAGFGDVIHMEFNESFTTFRGGSTSSNGSEMSVILKPDNFEEYAIEEDFSLKIAFSLTHIQKLCLTSKLVGQIQFFISNTSPMKIQYILDGYSNGENNNEDKDANDEDEDEKISNVCFYIAEKIVE